MQIYAIEGNRQALDGGALFGNAPKALWQRWLPADANNQITTACRTMLVRLANGKNILFEAGIGAFFEPKMRERFGVISAEHELINNLGKIGLSDADIDAVVLSHLHFDHAGGLLQAWQQNEPAQLLFPNAQFIVSEAHWQRACAPHMRDKASFIPDLGDLLRGSGRLVLVTNSQMNICGLEVKFSFSDGHTPGLMLSEIEYQQTPIVFTSDLIPASPWLNTPITMGYDRFPEALIDEKQVLLDDLYQRKAIVFFTHDLDIAASGLIRDERGRYKANSVQPEFIEVIS